MRQSSSLGKLLNKDNSVKNHHENVRGVDKDLSKSIRRFSPPLFMCFANIDFLKEEELSQ